MYIGLILIVQVIVIMLVLDRIKTVKSCRCPKKTVRFGWYHQKQASSPDDLPSAVITEERRVVKQSSVLSNKSEKATATSNGSGSSGNISSDLLDSTGMTTSCFLCWNKKKESTSSGIECEESRNLFQANEILDEDFAEDGLCYDDEDEYDEEEDDVERCRVEEQRTSSGRGFLSQTYSLIYNPKKNSSTRTSCLSLQAGFVRSHPEKRGTVSHSCSSKQISTYV
jgi:hypothetical protein